jgi:predicted nucleotidyltransferase
VAQQASKAHRSRFQEGKAGAIVRQDDVLQTLSDFRRDRQEEYGIVRIGIFGSAARDEITTGSDVDVVVELSEPDLLALVGIKQDLESLLSRQVDLFRYREKMNVFLKGRIDQEAVYA